MIGDRKIIALCTSRIYEATNYEFIMSLSEYFDKQGYCLLVYSLYTDLCWHEEALYRTIVTDRADVDVMKLIDFDVTDAVMIMSENIKSKQMVHEIAASAKKKNIPTFLVDGADDECYEIFFDYERGFEQIVRHVIEEHGVRKPHFMGGRENEPFSVQRLNVFKKVCQENGIKVDDSMISYGEFWAEPTIRAMKVLLQKDDVPEAIICANDVMAMNVAHELKIHGYKVPEDVIVTGFDGIDDVFFNIPKITTSMCNFDELAERITQILGDYFANRKMEKRYYVTTMPVYSESCGCDAAIDIQTEKIMKRINTNFYRFQDEDRFCSDVAAKVALCENINDASKVWSHYMKKEATCILKHCCVDETQNPIDTKREDSPEESWHMLLCKGEAVEDVMEKHKDGVLIPDMCQLVQRGKPIFFMALQHLGHTLGYICFHYEEYGSMEFCDMIMYVNSLARAIGTYRNNRYQNYLKKQMENMYQYDVLTGLYNRNGFIREYLIMSARARREQRQITAVLADLDGLKYINDTFGHAEGDNAIRAVADALKTACPKEALCARFGGDELIAFMDVECSDDALKNELNRFLDDFNAISQKPYKAEASIGIYHANAEDAIDFESLIKESDKLMYAEKVKRKKNRR
ncbi:MAG: GGDEF domain-containing protein [Lachnospiraceae bacterium]|nr:GGDEF domain-containing protein [Lachnospiraceae bacterium]